MSQPIMSVEGIGKRYVVPNASRERYTALRDVIARKTRQAAHAALELARGRRLATAETEAGDRFWALKDVTFDVGQGEVMGIVGRNGAGKSTLLKILSRITEPTEGRAILRGRVASLLEVGTGFHPELTGRENIYLNGAMLGMRRSEITAKFDEIVAFSEVERFLDTPVKRYSSGMYVRLAFAVAAHLEPEILVVDEVLAVGDAEFQKKCLGKMQDVASTDGRTVLFVSHNMAAVERLCTSAVLLRDGRCVARGETGSVVAEYLRDMGRSSQKPLTERRDRSGSGDVRILSVGLEGPGGSSVVAFQTGAASTLHFRLFNTTTRELRSFHLSIGIDNELGQRVALLDSELIGAESPRIPPGEQSVRFVVPKMTLLPGRYQITLYATINGAVADWIKNAAVVDVEAGDYFATGRLPPAGQGLFVMDHAVVYELDAAGGKPRTLLSETR